MGIENKNIDSKNPILNNYKDVLKHTKFNLKELINNVENDNLSLDQERLGECVSSFNQEDTEKLCSIFDKYLHLNRV